MQSQPTAGSSGAGHLTPGRQGMQPDYSLPYVPPASPYGGPYMHQQLPSKQHKDSRMLAAQGQHIMSSSFSNSSNSSSTMHGAAYGHAMPHGMPHRAQPAGSLSRSPSRQQHETWDPSLRPSISSHVSRLLH